MTNLEKYYKDILNIKNKIAIVNNKPKECEDVLHCKNCRLFNGKKCNYKEFIRWLAEEYISPNEKIILTVRQKYFLLSVGTGYLSRDSTGYLYYKKNKNSTKHFLNNIEKHIGYFSFISKEDPLKEISYILKNAEVTE